MFLSVMEVIMIFMSEDQREKRFRDIKKLMRDLQGQFCGEEVDDMKTVYPVFFTRTEDKILVEVPDLDILTEGTDMNQAIDMARDAIELKCVSMEDAKEEIPLPSDISFLDVAKGTFATDGVTIASLVDIDSGEYRRKTDTRTVRRNVALPSWLNYEAEHAGINVSRVLQEALMSTLGVRRN